MSNYLGTVIRIIGIFLGLVLFWFLVSFVLVLIASIVNIEFLNLTNIISVLGFIFLIKTFYPRFIFSN